MAITTCLTRHGAAVLVAVLLSPLVAGTATAQSGGGSPTVADDTFGALPTLELHPTPHPGDSPPPRDMHALETPSRVKPDGVQRNAEAGDDVVAVGRDGGEAIAILVDSVVRYDRFTSYVEQSAVPGASTAVRRRYVADCARQSRAFEPENSPAGAKLPATRVRPGSLEARELATACAMPDGPRQRWFAGFVVTKDGVVVAPHSRTSGCGSITMGWGATRRTLTLIAHEDDVSLLRIPDGGPWTAMPSTSDASEFIHVPVTLLGVSGTAPRVSAAFAEGAGANRDDPGWPQVLTLKDRALTDGIVWTSYGAALGLAFAIQPPGAHGATAFVRMVPVSNVRDRLARHGLTWPTWGFRPIDPEDAMRIAVKATVPLLCNRNP